jgi:hypothetical protein
LQPSCDLGPFGIWQTSSQRGQVVDAKQQCADRSLVDRLPVSSA